MKMSYNPFLSEYELKHIVWEGIEYDKDKLVKFVDRYNELLSSRKNTIRKEELRIMDEILKSHNQKNLEKLLNNDLEYSRWATIEKYSRIAAVEVVLDGKYSKKTFKIISNLPLSDYKLVIKRTKELVKILQEVTTETEQDTSKIPGVK
jgi:hypothetical protein